MRLGVSTLVASLGLGLLAPLAADAQPAGKVPRIGYLSSGSRAQFGHLAGAFQTGLRELGYVAQSE